MSVLSSNSGRNCFGVIVPDDACAPKISKGSIANCDPDAAVAHGNYVIARVPGVDIGICRRFHKADGLDPLRFELHPENGDYPKYVSTPEAPITVWRVVGVLTDID